MNRNEQLLSLGLDLARRRESLLAALQGDLASLERLSVPHGEPAEQALDSINETIASRLAEVESEELEKINDAMSRFESGVYGECEGCSCSIPLARLKALPYATLCISCQVKLEESGWKDWSELADHA
jgi:DnaK suppressor protein